MAQVVDQLTTRGDLVQAPDPRLSERDKVAHLLRLLPGATAERLGLQRYIRFGDHALLYKQVTHLGHPWPGFKKRIQIPHKWLEAYDELSRLGLKVHFIGIYAYEDTSVIVDFAPETYLLRKANNSAAHVSTIDLYQAIIHGRFEKVDSNHNSLTVIRGELFAQHLTTGVATHDDDYFEAIAHFNRKMLNGELLYGPEIARIMYDNTWPDALQGEWPGFYLEYRAAQSFASTRGVASIEFLKNKSKGQLDFDLRFIRDGEIQFLGDLKSSDYKKKDAPGNDQIDLYQAIQEHGRFWYLIYEHETILSKDRGHIATRQWNLWKESIGYFTRARKPFNELSYAGRYKDSVRYLRMMVLELNQANVALALGDFKQGKQPDGAKRAVKAMIKKSRIDNFLVYREGDFD